MKLASAILGVLFGASAVPASGQPANQPDDQRVIAIATASPCRMGPWNDSDKDPAPPGYIKGLALVYAKSYCETRRSLDTAASVMRRPLSPATQDALAWYKLNGQSDLDRLRMVYTLGFGLGMVESSGNTTEGRDPKVKHPTAANAEAGLFQTSYDSFQKDPWLAKLRDQYAAQPGSCQLAIFREGVTDLNRPLVGAGPGAEYQKLTKACPAFAAEYAMVILRVNRTHFGTINGHAAKYVKGCETMLRDIEAAVSCAP